MLKIVNDQGDGFVVDAYGNPIATNSEGKPVLLNAQELRVADINQRQCNALGYEIDITTLTTIMKKITEQKFFEIAPADYMPVRVGEGAWSSNLVTYRSFNLADDFSTGVVNTGGGNGRLAVGDAGVDSLPIKVLNWAKGIGWSLFDLQLAAKSGNWDLVSAKEKARKQNWDLGIQKVAFLGLAGDSGCLGLYTQTGSGVQVNSTIIPQSLSSLSPVDLKAFCSTVLNAYRSNAARTAWPTHFIIPESDYLGLAAPSVAEFPIQSVLEQLEKTFKVMTKNPNFQILPCAYGDVAYNSLTVQRYILLNYDETSVRMDIPVDYTNTLANSLDNFSFQNVGYGQFTGVLAYRPLEMLYFDYTP
jgi:hypothetical protein